MIAALRVLRRDVWNAASLDCASGRELSIRSDGAEQIKWSMTPQGLLRRQVGSEPPRSWELQSQIVFRADGPVVHISTTNHRFDQAIALSMVSQRLLAAGKGVP